MHENKFAHPQSEKGRDWCSKRLDYWCARVPSYVAENQVARERAAYLHGLVRERGMTLSAAGDTVGISSERVRNIINKHTRLLSDYRRRFRSPVEVYLTCNKDDLDNMAGVLLTALLCPGDMVYLRGMRCELLCFTSSHVVGFGKHDFIRVKRKGYARVRNVSTGAIIVARTADLKVSIQKVKQ
jgi:hypothetical protein